MQATDPDDAHSMRRLQRQAGDPIACKRYVYRAALSRLQLRKCDKLYACRNLPPHRAGVDSPYREDSVRWPRGKLAP